MYNYEIQSTKSFNAKNLCKCVNCGESKSVYVKTMGFNVITRYHTYNCSCESAIKEAILEEDVRLEGNCWDCVVLHVAVYPDDFTCFNCRTTGNKAGHLNEAGVCLVSKFKQRRMCPTCAKKSISCFSFLPI